MTFHLNVLMKRRAWPLIIASSLISSPSFSKPQNPITYCIEGNPQTLSPLHAIDTVSLTVLRGIYRRLFKYDENGAHLVPDIVNTWKKSNRGLVYTLSLKEGISFHSTTEFKPTRKLNPDDVVFTFKRMMDPKHPYYHVGESKYVYFEATGLGKIIKNVLKVSDHEVRFFLSRPYYKFLDMLALDFASVQSKEYADFLKTKNEPELIDRIPVGSGRFKFRSFLSDQRVTLTDTRSKNEDRPALVFEIVRDASVRLQKLKAGECDIINYPPLESIDQIKKSHKFRLLKSSGNNTGFLALNTKVKPLDNILVRRAIYHALNREKYIKQVYKGQAILARSPIPPFQMTYHSALTHYPYSPSLARKLLAEANLKKGFEIELMYLPISRAYNPNGKKLAELMQHDLKMVGIRAKLVTFDWGAYFAKAFKTEHQMLQAGLHPPNNNSGSFLDLLLMCDGFNFSNWCNPKYDLAVKQGLSSDSELDMMNHFKTAQEIFHQEVPWVPIAHGSVLRAISNKVTGFQVNRFGLDDLQTIAWAEEEKNSGK